MFYGLASGHVDTGGIVVDQVLSDIETLNRAAFDGQLRSDGRVVSRVRASGRQVRAASARREHGRQVRADRRAPATTALSKGVKGSRIAIPGTLTTAYLTLRLYEPDFQYVVVPFDQIQQAVLEGKAHAGLLIHEGQLTYQDEGLRKIVDLGEWWAERTGGLPLPLGGNIIRRDLGSAMIAQGLEDAPRQHCLRAVAPAGGRRVRAAVRSWPRPGEDGPVRWNVRQRSHTRLRRARPTRSRTSDVGRVPARSHSSASAS